MRLLFTAITCLLTLSLWAQDGINYQGAATDANGDELTNQSITLRASVLSASATYIQAVPSSKGNQLRKRG
jgi:hypothetical protein